MEQTFEAIWSHGKIIPKEPVNFKENTHLKIIVLDDQAEVKNDWMKLRGKFKGKLSTVDEFIRNKKDEKRLEL
jgi:predicted DNA-binding antitoxin AbrB/MazE fold protein